MRRFSAVLGLLVGVCLVPHDARAEIIGLPTPGIILDVRDTDTPGADSVLHTGGLFEGVLGFVDRDYTWIDIPTTLVGADYIQSAQDNADVTDALGTTMTLEVDVADGTILHMFIDERIAGLIPFPWMNAATFGVDWMNSGVAITGGDFPEGDLPFQIWSTVTPLAAGTYIFRQQPDDASFYGIAATAATPIPEPATMFLFGTGLAAVAAARKRRRIVR